MKYMVRLRNYEGSVIDGEIYCAENRIKAELMYMIRMDKLGIQMSKEDYITVEEYEF